MVRALIIGSAASFVSLFLGGPLIALLERFGIRKSISDEGPESHMAKAGTVTMGGLLMLIIILVFTIPTNLAATRRPLAMSPVRATVYRAGSSSRSLDC